MLKDRLVDIYSGTNEPQLLQELASISLESRNLPDTYYYRIVGEKIVPPTTLRPAEEYMSNVTPLEKLEYDAFQDIQTWATQQNEGLSFWLSPPHYERSPQAKIIISELETENGRKTLLNRTILFDVEHEGCLDIANKIQRSFNGIDNSYITEHQMRRFPIFVNQKYFTSQWLSIVEELITAAEEQWNMVSTGEDFKEAERTLDWAYEFAQGRDYQGQYIGNNQLSCPIEQLMSPFQILQINSIEGKYVRKCGNLKCRTKIEKVIYAGYICKRCKGIYHGC